MIGAAIRRRGLVMVEIKELNIEEIKETLGRLNYGHLACCSNDHPYVVPIHYAYDGEAIYVYTTEGKKAEIIAANPEVCLQAEDVENNEHWVSVIAIGDAKRLIDPDERGKALDLILEVNPRLTPAVSVRWMDSWIRENVEVVYRIHPGKLSGRKTIGRPPKVPISGRAGNTAEM